MLAQKKDAKFSIIEGLHSHYADHKVSNTASKKLITKTALDTAMLVVAHTLYEIPMSQYAINADQT